MPVTVLQQNCVKIWLHLRNKKLLATWASPEERNVFGQLHATKNRKDVSVLSAPS